MAMINYILFLVQKVDLEGKKKKKVQYDLFNKHFDSWPREMLNIQTACKKATYSDIFTTLSTKKNVNLQSSSATMASCLPIKLSDSLNQTIMLVLEILLSLPNVVTN